jgi:ribosomal protein S18 acetylase RimI-like enzyme
MPLVLEPSWVGRRVSVRRVLHRATPDGPHYTDIVGDLVDLDTEHAVVEARTGPVELLVRDIAVAKLVPASTRDELELQAVAERGWRAAETHQIGGWLLRADSGFTGRANSVLPLAPPDMSVSDAIAEAQDWYASRGLPTRFQLPVHGRRLLDAELGERGWEPSPDVHVMTARLDVLARSATTDPDVFELQVDAVPADNWFAQYRDGAGADPSARALLSRHDRVGFASAMLDGELVAIGRGTVDEDWLGITAVEVGAAHRRRGFARAVMSALWSWGSALGANRTYLAVSSDNVPGVALYHRLGYRVHHDYRYRTESAT